MPKINVPLGKRIEHTDEKILQIQVVGTQFWVIAEQNKKTKLWTASLSNPHTGFRKKLSENVPTDIFVTLSNTVLKTPFPFVGKKAEEEMAVYRFIKKTLKTTKV